MSLHGQSLIATYQTSLENRAFEFGKSTPIAKVANSPPSIAAETVSMAKVGTGAIGSAAMVVMTMPMATATMAVH